MLDDRAATVESVKSIGADYAKITDKAEKQQIQAQLRDLTQRWEALVQSQADRQAALEAALDAAKIFTDRLIPFLEWLEPTEKKVSAMENLEPDAEKISHLMEEQQAVNRDIAEHKPNLDDIVVSGSELLKHAKGGYNLPLC